MLLVAVAEAVAVAVAVATLPPGQFAFAVAEALSVALAVKIGGGLEAGCLISTLQVAVCPSPLVTFIVLVGPNEKAIEIVWPAPSLTPASENHAKGAEPPVAVKIMLSPTLAEATLAAQVNVAGGEAQLKAGTCWSLTLANSVCPPFEILYKIKV